VTTIDLNPDAPHSPERTRELADVAAEAVRTLNYATAPGKDGLTYPGDAYELLGALWTLSQRLPQLCHQTVDYLRGEQDAGRLGETPNGPHHGDAGAAVGEATEALWRAVTAANDLTGAFKEAQAAIRAVEYVASEQVPCPDCGGRGMADNDEPCLNCGGTGWDGGGE
jgi:hypothetical protein